MAKKSAENQEVFSEKDLEQITSHVRVMCEAVEVGTGKSVAAAELEDRLMATLFEGHKIDPNRYLNQAQMAAVVGTTTKRVTSHLPKTRKQILTSKRKVVTNRRGIGYHVTANPAEALDKAVLNLKIGSSYYRNAKNHLDADYDYEELGKSDPHISEILFQLKRRVLPLLTSVLSQCTEFVSLYDSDPNQYSLDNEVLGRPSMRRAALEKPAQ